MKLVDVGILSGLLAVKPKTLYQWAELGQIPSIKLNGLLRFDMAEIDKWILGCKNDCKGSCYNNITQAKGPKRRDKHGPV